MNYEQTDLILRIIDKGYKAIYTPKAILWHKGSFSTGGLGNPYMMYWEGKSKLIIHYLYQNGFAFLKFYFSYLGIILWSLGKGIIKKIALGRYHNKTKNSYCARFSCRNLLDIQPKIRNRLQSLLEKINDSGHFSCESTLNKTGIINIKLLRLKRLQMAKHQHSINKIIT